MTAVTRLAASLAIATLALGWGAMAKAADVLPAGSNVNAGAPASQSATFLNFITREADITTNYNYGKTNPGDPTADQNAFADLSTLFALDLSNAGVADNADPAVSVKRIMEATPPQGSSTPVEQIPGGVGVVDSFTFQALAGTGVHIQAGGAVSAPGGTPFTGFTLSLFKLDPAGDGLFDVSGGFTNGDTTLLGTGSGSGVVGDPAVVDAVMDANALYAVVVQAVTPDGLWNKANYEVAMTFGEVVSEVPLPAAFWLLISGIVGLIGFARVRRASSSA